MGEKHLLKKLVVLQWKIGVYKAKASMYRGRNNFKKYNKFEWKANRASNKISMTCLKLQRLSSKLKHKEMNARHLGRTAKADLLVQRIRAIDDKVRSVYNAPIQPSQASVVVVTLSSATYAATPNAPPQANASKATRVLCKRCGKQTDSAERLCTNCGARL